MLLLHITCLIWPPAISVMLLHSRFTPGGSNIDLDDFILDHVTILISTAVNLMYPLSSQNL